jgi:hypothetical protein
LRVRIAVLSDIHGNLPALAAVPTDLAPARPRLEAAARLADRNGRPDWAVALRTGVVAA